MKAFDLVLSWILLAFALLHTTAAVAVMSKNFTIDSAWFFAGGLAIIFGVFLNLIRAHRPGDKAIARTSLLTNLLLVILSLLLCVALRHQLKQNPQAVVLVLLVVLELLFSLRSLSLRAG
ncbi:MAG TPA: hypothetical protein VKW06_21275 [Candidatus Angelobacter sp.]|nr:hypothetical protein [Candidatus Angelobacter sp.]